MGLEEVRAHKELYRGVCKEIGRKRGKQLDLDKAVDGLEIVVDMTHPILAEHFLVKEPDPRTNIYVCKYCNREFESREEAISHFEEKHGKDVKA